MECARKIFRLPSDGALPPLPGAAPRGAPHALALLLEELLDAAGANLIPAPARAPDTPTIVDGFDTLKAASDRYEVAPGISLADHLWTHAAAYHSGAIARQLAQTAHRGRPVQGFLVLYAAEVHSPLLYCANMSPVRVRDAIGTPSDGSGPYLALVACEGRPDGSAEAICGYALPVLSAQRFVPVRSELDRDVLRALEHFQVTLDAHGIECAVQRIRPRTASTVTTLNLTLTTPAGRKQHFRLAIDPVWDASSARGGCDPRDFTVTHRNWKDGGFVAWLEQSLVG